MSVCPVCKFDKLSDMNVFTSVTPSGFYISEDINNKTNFKKCNNCDSLISDFFDKNSYINFPEESNDSNNLSDLFKEPFVRHYVESGAGLDSMMQPIFSVLQNIKISSYLEIGSGFGFNLDFMRFVNPKCRIKGFEAASYGQIGSIIFDLPIVNEYLTTSTKINKKYDFIFSSEVIEHVDDPYLFLDVQISNTTENGIIAFTTPNSGYIKPGANDSITLAVLSPGFHSFVLSKKGIEIILSNLGIRNFKIIEKNERLIVFFSPNINVNSIELISMRDSYTSYLKMAVSKNSPKPLELGYVFRYFKELINQGDSKEAEKYIERYENIHTEIYSLNLFDLKSLVNSAEDSSNLTEVIENGLSSISQYLYYKGFINYFNENYDVAEKYFISSITIIRRIEKIASAINQEGNSLLAPNYFHLGMIELVKGNNFSAYAIFNNILLNFGFSGVENLLDKLINKRVLVPDFAYTVCVQLAVSINRLGMIKESYNLLDSLIKNDFDSSSFINAKNEALRLKSTLFNNA